jgi:DNA-binding NarL/FixJ family response regulator
VFGKLELYIGQGSVLETNRLNFVMKNEVYIAGKLIYGAAQMKPMRAPDFRCSYPGQPLRPLLLQRQTRDSRKEGKPMGTKKKVVIAEDHQLFREGLKAMLAARDDLEVVGEAQDGLEAIRCVKQSSPDLLLLDLSMPRLSGISVMKDVKSQFPAVRILALTIHESDQYVLEAFEAGADGYCIKDASRQELIVAINSVLEGKKYISPGIADYVMEGYLEGRKRLKTRTSWDSITQREREVLKLLAEGYMNKDIGELLNISVKTVEKHRANIMNKLDLHNASALTAYAIERGLVTKKS